MPAEASQPTLVRLQIPKEPRVPAPDLLSCGPEAAVPAQETSRTQAAYALGRLQTWVSAEAAL